MLGPSPDTVHLTHFVNVVNNFGIVMKHNEGKMNKMNFMFFTKTRNSG